MKKLQAKEISSKKLKRYQYFQTFIRILGALIVVIDVCCKI